MVELKCRHEVADSLTELIYEMLNIQLSSRLTVDIRNDHVCQYQC